MIKLGLDRAQLDRLEDSYGSIAWYKYFPDVEAILMTWRERQVTGHLHQLVAFREGVRIGAAAARRACGRTC